jgi:hypothetical protein
MWVEKIPASREHYTIAADPGVGETGLILLAPGSSRDVLEYATFSCPPNGSAFGRTMALSDQIAMRMGVWMDKYAVEYVDICIETPIWNKSPRSFELQWRLVQAIEMLLYMHACLADLKECWITEVPPTTSKRLATSDGGASKDRVAEFSPFERGDFKSVDTWRTLGDTWAHSLAAWGAAGTRRNFTKLKLGKVVENIGT